MSADDLEVIGYTPFNAETPVERLSRPVTPAENVYVRTNFDIPQLDPRGHRIRIDGAVDAGFDLSVTELQRMPQVRLTTTMECAGNDRLSMRPIPRGEPWQGGALSTVEWRGVPLRAMLERASIAPGVVEMLVEGADKGKRDDAEGPVTFARGVPIADALAPDTLLALEMNGAPLTPPHGAPVRLVVPGWYGMTNVKWVTRLSALTTPYAGYFQTKRYVYKRGDATEPVRLMRVKSIIVAPSDGSTHGRGALRVWGWAWTGEGRVTRVEVALGDGEWLDATVDEPAFAYCWVRWEREIDLERAGRVVLRSRATDSTGTTQPDVAEWNQLGYGNNAIQSTIIEVRR